MPEQTYSDKLAYSDKLDVELRFQEDDTRQSSGHTRRVSCWNTKRRRATVLNCSQEARFTGRKAALSSTNNTSRKSPIVRAVPLHRR